MKKRGLVALVAVGLATLGPARAEVTGVEVLERSAFASGMPFGAAGAYEKIRGIARFSLDPNAAANQRIVDLKLAPHDASGGVTFESSFILLALDRWTRAGALPPSSAYPNLRAGTLVSVDAYRAAFPRNIGLSPPGENLREPRLDFGPRFASEGIADHVPPLQGPPFETRVPAPDADGNDRGGVRLIDLHVPLGTHTGWNQRAPETGFPWATARFDGSFVAFPCNEAERRAIGDPRPSIESRHPTRNAFVVKVRAAAKRQVAAGFLLSEDVERAVSEQVALYDRTLAHAPEDQSCQYLFAN